jgi:ArsR family transcriptional regulator
MLIMSLAQMFKALSEEIRLRIISLLTGGELCVCDLIAVLDLPQSTISRHLAYLKNAGWVEGERRGVWMYYRLNEPEDALRANLMQALAAMLVEEPKVGEDLSRLTAYLQTRKANACG